MSFSGMPGYRPGHDWAERHDQGERTFTRRLGTLEERFNIAGRNGGQSDTFVKLRLRLAGRPGREADDRLVFLARLVLAWTRLRARHPLLAATIHDDTESSIPGCPARRVGYKPPTTPNEALDRARASFLLARGDELDRTVRDILEKPILNGDRVILDEARCLARLILVEGASPRNELGFFLVISHTISDGLSVLKLVNELFATASSAELCSPEERPTFLDFDDFLRGSMSVKLWDVSPDLHRQWGMTLEADEIKRTLPLATEDHMPPLPVTSNESQSLLQPIELPTRLEAADRIRHEPKTTARKRWCWAISRTIILARQRRCPHTRPFPRVERESPPTNVCTKWESIKFDQDTTARLLRFCKVNAQSPSMLLYAMLALAAANLLPSHHQTEPYFPILIGFPFSARPVLERAASPSTDPASDLAIRLTFTSIVLPNFAVSLERENRERVRRTVLQSARLAKRQLAQHLAPDRLKRTICLAAADAMNMDRLLFRHGQARPPWEAPSTCVNGSMIGDVDRMLERKFAFERDEIELSVSDLEIGVRLHKGEGMFFEGFTFDGSLQLSCGYDEELIDSRHAWSILDGVKEIGHLIATVDETT